MYAIYGNIYHQYTPNVSIYTSTMDPMGMNVNYFHIITWYEVLYLLKPFILSRTHLYISYISGGHPLTRLPKVQKVLMEFCDSERLWTWIREPGGERGGSKVVVKVDEHLNEHGENMWI